MLIVVSGLPGAGKSALADALGGVIAAPVLSVDPVEAAMWTAGIDRAQPTGLAAYVVADVITRRILALGQTVIVDAVNGVSPAQAQWQAVAADLDVPLRVIEVVCSDEETHRARLASRVRNIIGFPEPTWADVVAVRDGWDNWPDEHLVLDSVHDLSTNVACARAYLNSSSIA